MRRLKLPVAVVVLVGLLAIEAWAQRPAPNGTRSAGSISGRIIDQAGRPIAGATVRLHSFNGPFSGKIGLWSAAISEIQADDAGRFRFSESDELPFSSSPKRTFIVAVKGGGYASAFRKTPMDQGEQVTVDVVARRPASVEIELRDAAGQAVCNASLRRLNVRGENGEFDPRCDDFEKFGLATKPSDQAGRLRLPELPSGVVVDAVIRHDDMAPIEVKDIAILPGSVVGATMRPGVPVQLRIAPDAQTEGVAYVAVFWRQDRIGSTHASTIWFERFPVDRQGLVRFTTEAGAYSTYLLHESFHITSTDRLPDGPLQIGADSKKTFSFQSHRKAPARGRVIADGTGEPVAGVDVDGEIPSRVSDGAEERYPADWSSVASAVTDERGEYVIDLAAGRARVMARGVESESIEFNVARDGSTMIPDLTVRRLPTVAGKVLDADGRPVAGAIVRLRGDMCAMQPALTDQLGFFELALPWLRRDEQSGKPLVIQPLVAFDPLRPLSAKIEVKLDDPKSIANATLVLQPQECQRLLSDFSAEMGDWERGEVSKERMAEARAQSLEGRPAPELDGLIWLNAPRESMRLADFRGKYVLLDFWTTWCGPCHADFPTLKLLHELYKDRGLAVISIHDNSVPADAVREHVKRQELPFPVVIDRPDGQILSRYKPHGVRFYPSYLLIGPDGNVLHQDAAIPGPSLHTYMFEIIRGYLIGK